MPVDFDLDATDTESEQAATAEAVVAALTAPTPRQAAAPVRTLEEEIDEVERRLERAQYYKLLLREPLFDDNGEAAASVNAEVRDFVQTRLRILMGVEPEHTRATLEETINQVLEDHFGGFDGIRALQLLIGAALKRKVESKTRAKPSDTPQEGKRGPGRPRKVGPTLRRVEVPSEIRSNTPATTAPAPQQPVAPTAPVPKPSPKNPAELKAGDIITENGRTYEIIERPGKDGKPELFPKDVTKQARPATIQPVPMPTREAYAAVTMAQAAQQVERSLAAATGEVGGGIAAAASRQPIHVTNTGE